MSPCTPDQPLRRKPPSDPTYKRRRKRPNKWLVDGEFPSSTRPSVGILGASPLGSTTARNELYVMGQDGQLQRHQGSQHLNLQQQVQDFMSGTGFFEQPDIG